jgi:SpoIID/LytB domain protein
MLIRALASILLCSVALSLQAGDSLALASGRGAPRGAAHRSNVADLRAPAPQLLIRGAGDGHGVGMSQYGALGYAQHGYTYTQILAHYYTGTRLTRIGPGRRVRVLLRGRIIRLPLERYVRGVVGAEMPASWPPAALEAQAVAARTYALTADAGGARFDVYADTRSQVYAGSAAESARSNAAVAATAGQILTYEGHPAISYYFSSSGGMTEDVQNAFPGAAPAPWLVGVPDPYDGGPLHRWRLTLAFAAVERRLAGLLRGSLRAIEVTKRGYSPRILTAVLVGSRGRTPITGAQLAERLGLYSTWAYFFIRKGGKTVAEPDRSGWRAPGAPAPGAGAPRTGAPGSGSTSKSSAGQSGGAGVARNAACRSPGCSGSPRRICAPARAWAPTPTPAGVQAPGSGARATRSAQAAAICAVTS